MSIMIEWIVSSCVLILMITAIRQLFRNRLDLKVRYALWLIVAVRLLVPFSFAESRFSILNMLEAEENFRTAEREAGGSSDSVHVSVVNPEIFPEENEVDSGDMYGEIGLTSGVHLWENSNASTVF